MKFERQLNRELPIWIEKQIISEEQAKQINALYPPVKRADYSISLIIFSIVGSLLIGGGIILIFARNWSELPVSARTAISFFPLVISQGLTAYLIYKRNKSDAWREGVGIFYTLSVYACIALIGQIYHLPGSFEGYVLLCSVLIFPICYFLKATTPILVYIIGLTVWATARGTTMDCLTLIYYLALLTLAAPHIWMRLKENAYNAYSQLILWCLAICGFVISVRHLTFSSQYFSTMCLYFSTIYLISAKWMDNGKPIILQPLKAIGFAGGIVMLFIMSSSSWHYMQQHLSFSFKDNPQIIFILLMSLFCLTLIFTMFSARSFIKFLLTLLVGSIFLVQLIISLIWNNAPNLSDYAGFGQGFFISAYIFAIGILLIVDGLRETRFYYASIGTVIISSLTIFRFFDSSLDFFVRGVIFIFVGALFLISNVLISKRLKREALSGDRDA